MKTMRRSIRCLLACFILLATLVPAHASIERTIETEMRDSLLRSGIRTSSAAGIAKQYLFIGVVMIQNTQPMSTAEEERLLEQAGMIGRALGNVLGSAHTSYGAKKLQEAATMMMHSVRAGVLPEVASDTFSALALNGYAFDAAVSILHEASEFVRTLRPSDRGRALCTQIRAMVLDDVPVGSIKKELAFSVERERLRQKELLARNEEERRKRDMRGGNHSTDGFASSREGETGGRAAGGQNDNKQNASASDSSQNASSGTNGSDTSGSDTAGDDTSSSNENGTDSGQNDQSDSSASSSESSGGQNSTDGGDNANDNSSNESDSKSK